MDIVCRQCDWKISGPDVAPGQRCPSCHSPRLLAHEELFQLAVAHVDCDAFYAAVEKRDDPSLVNKAVIVAHDSARSVVSTCCYIARMSGVHSAMPLFQAKKRCPDAVIIRPDMKKYSIASKEIHKLFQKLTPEIEPLSLDEAFLDLRGCEKLHGRTAAESMTWLAKEIQRTVGITVSVGLSYNKSLAKLASDLDKPNGYAVIGREEAMEFLAPRPVRDIWGVGQALGRTLSKDGIVTIGQLQHREKTDLMARYGAMGSRLFHFARGNDDRKISSARKSKSISAETTFNLDISDINILSDRLWPLCDKVARRLKIENKAGKTITLKLKTDNFQTVTRSHTLAQPTQIADILFQEALPMLTKASEGRRFRLIGIGISSFGNVKDADPPDFLNPDSIQVKIIDAAMDKVRDRFGDKAIVKGRSLK